MQYFYKLGHQPELSLREFESKTNSDSNFYNQSWVLSDQKISVNKLGSMIFRGKVLAEFDLENQSKLLKELDLNISPLLQRFKEKEGLSLKKIGLSQYYKEKEENPLRKKFYTFLSKKVFNLLKESGSKKVNSLELGVLPSFGNFKNTKHWLIFFNIGKKLFLGYVEEYFDQEFWAEMDQKLPASEMKKGLINLKLARTLLNFSSQKVIWDPFCGLNRNLIAGIDQKDQFLASDIDEECLPGAQKNFIFAREFFAKKLKEKRDLEMQSNLELESKDSEKNIETQKEESENKEIETKTEKNITKKVSILEPKLGVLKGIKTLKANNLSKINFGRDIDFSKVGIVTEGHLGRNFASFPDDNMIANEFAIVSKIWQEVLAEAQKLQIPEIIFCLPFYQLPKKKIYPDFWSNLTYHNDYEFEHLGMNKKFLTYARKDSITGHFILKVVLK